MEDATGLMGESGGFFYGNAWIVGLIIGMLVTLMILRWQGEKNRRKRN
ncbi:MAG: hypothetical protein AAF433_13245 [Bacteroidota bacterium]